MMLHNDQDWFCIVNPYAGSGKTMPEWRKAEEILTEFNIPYKTTFTNYKFHAALLAYESAMHGYRKIVAVGGDGSVHEVFNGIMKFVDESGVSPEEFTLGVVPIGSGNDWIKSLGIPKDPREVIKMMGESSFARQDIVRVETSAGISYMVNVGGVGFDSHVCEWVNAQKELGRRSRTIYFSGLIYSLVHARKFHTDVVADGVTVFSGDAYSMAFGNGPYSGGGMRQVPMSVMDDGLLDYMIVPKANLLRLAVNLPRLYSGTVNESGLLITGKCREIVVTGENLVEVDGEVKGNLPLTITMTGRQINVLGKRQYL